MRVGCYIRVSSKEQREGFSLDAQRSILTAYCHGRGWTDRTWYTDEGQSAYRTGGRSCPPSAHSQSPAAAGTRPRPSRR